MWSSPASCLSLFSNTDRAAASHTNLQLLNANFSHGDSYAQKCTSAGTPIATSAMVVSFKKTKKKKKKRRKKRGPQGELFKLD